ncbi:two-partner secretion domain-containing protein [Calothrix sp. NIES-3974]|uniref:two-partner secretion domain-containing protein n=1 Tax=Calothrix sp. NIES-3974 TaxID=2005462 RepID=UPI000B621358|nr:filamentous hemagglutinin N-terminal domain-containing protein [Calothrix sp. NIES-3974]BAZ07329.1 filamentous hemagglutinin outer membrane protein [Calothrix sp. NIES-3974]
MLKSTPWLMFPSLILCINPSSLAQITPDNTLGTEASQITPNVIINGGIADRIEGGATRGINHFHSFREFNIGNGQRVYFANPSGVENILTRVTGGNGSNIFGTLGVDGNANLFLINPNGIVFGENAVLDIRGSFVGTTANAVQFSNQGLFDATNPQAVPLLTVNPSALFYNQLNPGGITVRSRQISAPGSFYLIGGDVVFDGGVVGSLGGSFGLGAVGGTGSIELIGSGKQMQLRFPENLLQGNIALQKNAFALTTGGGAISIHTKNLRLGENSFISTTLAPGEGESGVAAADLVINATGEVILDDRSNILNLGLPDSLGDTGNIIIKADSVSLTNQSQINSNGTRSQGSIILNVNNDVNLVSGSAIATTGNPSPVAGKTGDISITARNINLNAAKINSGNFAVGASGKINLQVQDKLSLSNGANISSASSASIFGRTNSFPSADIEIKAKTLSIDGEGTNINSSNLDEGRGGNIQITVDDSIDINTGYIDSLTLGKGDGGNIQLQTQRLTLTNGGYIRTRATGAGNSGDLFINASELVSLSGNKIINLDGVNTAIGSSLGTNASGSGNGGKLTINTGVFTVKEGAQVGAGTFGSGKGGNLTVNARQVEVNGRSEAGSISVLFASAAPRSTGDAGNLNINTENLFISAGGEISVSTSAAGKGGNLTVNASETVRVTGSSNFSTGLFAIADTGSTGDAGDLTIISKNLILEQGGQASTSTYGAGRGGNLTIKASENVQLIGAPTNSRFPTGLFAAAEPGSTKDAGDLVINTQNLSITNGAKASTTTFGKGKAGNLQVNASTQVNLIGTSPNGRSLSGLFASTERQATGDAGSIIINTPLLAIRDGAQVTAATFTSGRGGNLDINSQQIELIGTSPLDTRFVSGLLVSTERGASGDGGNINVNTERLVVRDGAQIVAATSSSGQAGNLDIKASQQIELIGTSPTNTRFVSGLIASSEPGAKGDAGSINVTTPNLILRNGGHIVAATFTTGKGGDLNVNASDQVILSGRSGDKRYPSSLLTSTEPASQGDAGDLFVNTKHLFINDGAGIGVNSQGTGNAGILTLKADTIRLDNKAFLNANTRSPNKDPNREQATINLNTNALILRRNSNITTNATGENVIGGNININARVLAALENSDISANSADFRGGRVSITSQGIFGTQPRQFPTPESDITATGATPELSGTTEINKPDLDPTQGLIELPRQIRDHSNEVGKLCPRTFEEAQKIARFVVIGRGGSIPLNTLDPFPGTIENYNLVGLDESLQALIPSAQQIQPREKKTVESLLEAQGWVKSPDGKILLVAQAPEAAASSHFQASSCP